MAKLHDFTWRYYFLQFRNNKSADTKLIWYMIHLEIWNRALLEHNNISLNSISQKMGIVPNSKILESVVSKHVLSNINVEGIVLN